MSEVGVEPGPCPLCEKLRPDLVRGVVDFLETPAAGPPLPLSPSEDEWIKREIAVRLRRLTPGGALRPDECLPISESVLGAEKPPLLQVLAAHGFRGRSATTRAMLDRLFVEVVRRPGYGCASARVLVAKRWFRTERLWGVPSGRNKKMSTCGGGVRLVSVERLDVTGSAIKVMESEDRRL